jgi:hypothetical protein
MIKVIRSISSRNFPHRLGECAAHNVGCPPNRVSGQMGVSFCGLGVQVTEQFSRLGRM